jgi:hypothetical protein
MGSFSYKYPSWHAEAEETVLLLSVNEANVNATQNK